MATGRETVRGASCGLLWLTMIAIIAIIVIVLIIVIVAIIATMLSLLPEASYRFEARLGLLKRLAVSQLLSALLLDSGSIGAL